MHEHARRPRRERDGQTTPEPARPSQGISNRALQRLYWDGMDGKVYADHAWVSQVLPFDTKTRLMRDDEKLKPGDPTLRDIFEWDAARKAAVAGGLNVTFVTGLVGQSAAQLTLLGNAATTDAALQADLAAAARSRNRIVISEPNDPIVAANKPARSPFVMEPLDFFAQKRDLKKGIKAMDKIPGKGKLTYYHKMCTLIALVKDTGGLALAKTITKDDSITDLKSAVQALHDHYLDKNVDYDDSSTRFTVMNEWGYQMIYSGSSAWMELTSLPAGGYIFDIPGHTVHVTLKKPLPAAWPKKKGDFSEYFEPDSDKDNFPRGTEKTFPVRYIWKK
jgi:hypothetical protein